MVISKKAGRENWPWLVGLLLLGCYQPARSHPAVLFKALYTNKFKYATNSKPRYAAGALVYKQAGEAGFQTLGESDNTYESFLSHFAALMHLSPTRAEAFLQKSLLKFASQKSASGR